MDEAQLKSRYISSSNAQLLVTAFPQHRSCKILAQVDHLGLLFWKYICRTAIKFRNTFLNSIEFIYINMVCNTKVMCGQNSDLFSSAEIKIVLLES